MEERKEMRYQLKLVEVREKDITALQKMKNMEAARKKKTKYKQNKIKIMNGVRIIYTLKDE
jgi:hypothetical protein